MSNLTFKASTPFECKNIDEDKGKYEHDPIWRQTHLGCSILQILQDMYNFNVTYVVERTYEDALHSHKNITVDFFVTPVSMKEEYYEQACPIHSIFRWRFGFLLRYKQENIFDTFYSLPFTSRVWTCVVFILLLSSIVFYFLSYWEKRFIGGECEFDHELLLAFSALCQHILPLQANLYSRRIAYLIFILCAYVIHCFYTSNLLSHLVNDKDKNMNLITLAENDYDLAIIEDNLSNLITEKRFKNMNLDKNLSIIMRKIRKIKIMNVSTALEAIRFTKTAVLSDYTTLYPIIKRTFDNHAQCQLVEVDLYSMVKKYLFTSKNFLYREQFKIGILRAKETGVIHRLPYYKSHKSISCKYDAAHHPSGIEYTVIPIVILFASSLLALSFLIAEIVYFKSVTNNNNVWPYLD